MKTILADLELDMEEIRLLADCWEKEQNTVLIEIMKRRVVQMHSHLDNVLSKLDAFNAVPVPNTVNSEVPVEEPLAEETPTEEETPVPTVTEPAKPVKNLRDLFALNDLFLFSRELFEGDMERMNQVLRQVAVMESGKEVHEYLQTVVEVKTEEADEVFNDFLARINNFLA
ncbi:hypothetical protein LJC72_00130 [Bacteroides sp. OttesenSCG-928-D19]|nr:hypothetical protein [Bacteroides sp. OttesenSCG-928-D19]